MTYARHAGGQQAARTKRQRESREFLALLTGDFVAEQHTMHSTAHPLAQKVYYDRRYWCNRFFDAKAVIRQARANGDYDNARKFSEFASDYLNRIKACEYGRYEVAGAGDPQLARRQVVANTDGNRHQQASAESGTLVSASDPTRESHLFSTTTPDNPAASKLNGAGVVSSTEQHPIKSDVQLESNNLAASGQVPQHEKLVIPYTLRSLKPVDQRPGWIAFDLSSTKQRMLKWYTVAELQSLNPGMVVEVQQESTPETVEPAEQAKRDAMADMAADGMVIDEDLDEHEDANDRDRLPALDCCEVNLRAAFEAFGKNDMETFDTLTKMAQEDLERYADDSRVLRARGWGIVSLNLLKPELIISDSIEDALQTRHREFVASIEPRTDPADVIARAFGKKAS